MSNEEFIDYNRMGEEECTITVRCKSKDLPQIKQALIQAQGCAAGEDVRANRGEGERELKEREEDDAFNGGGGSSRMERKGKKDTSLSSLESTKL